MVITFELTLFNERTEELKRVQVKVPEQSTACRTVQLAKGLACHVLGWKEENVSIIETKWIAKEVL